MGSNFLQAEVMTTLWNMFQLVSTRGQSTVHCYIQMKIAIPQGPASSASYSLKTALNSSLHCVPGWMICDDVTLLQRIAQIFPLKAAPGPPSIFHGTENSQVKTQLPLAGARYFLRWLYVPTYMDFCMVVTGTTLSRAELWTWLQIPDSCLSCLYVSDIKQGICTFLYSTKKKSDLFLGSFLPVIP